MFLAGIMLGETQFRHQINIEIRPFRDVLLGLFFVSIGMLVNITTWFHTWIWILLLLIALMIGKTLLIIILCRFSKYDLVSSTRTGLVLSQGGEFGFAILSLALAKELIPLDYSQAVLATLLITFALAPIIIRYNEKIAKFFFPKIIKLSHEKMNEDIKTISESLSDHIIICGYGRVGQNISRLLSKINCPYIGLDLDPEIIRNAQLAGDCVAYGNAKNFEILKTARLEKAKALVISFNDVHTAISIIEQVRHFNHKISILVRCQDESEYEELLRTGATKIVTEVFEESLSLISHLLHLIHTPETTITKLLQTTRNKNYALLYQIFPGSFIEEEEMHEYLRPIPLPEKAQAVNRTLRELSLQHVKVIAIRRGKKHLKPRNNIKLQAGDILILYGLPSHLDVAEEALLA